MVQPNSQYVSIHKAHAISYENRARKKVKDPTWWPHNAALDAIEGAQSKMVAFEYSVGTCKGFPREHAHGAVRSPALHSTAQLISISVWKRFGKNKFTDWYALMTCLDTDFTSIYRDARYRVTAKPFLIHDHIHLLAVFFSAILVLLDSDPSKCNSVP